MNHMNNKGPNALRVLSGRQLICRTALAVSALMLPALAVQAQTTSHSTTQTTVKKAQSNETRTVTGKVVDENNEPVIGASITVDGTNQGVSTDLDGNFTISVRPSASLTISSIGFNSQKVKVGNKSKIDVILSDDAKLLDEVVVIGYGTTDRKRVTTAISTMKGDEMVKGLGGSTIATAIKSKIPGLVIDSTNNPNGSPTFQLRGVASVNGSNSPLIVIDGIPGGDIRSINQEDIESIDVLKDASAGAIYGTRAAGGVILITTKSGKAGKTKVTYSSEISVDHLRTRPEMLSADEYRKEFVEQGYGADYGYSTDWYGEMINDNAVSNRQTLTINGGTDNANIYASLMYAHDDGIIKKNNRTDYSGRINGNFKTLRGKVEFAPRLQVRQTIRENLGTNSTLYTAMQANPTIPLMDPDNPTEYNVDNAGLGGTQTSPVADIMYRDAEQRDTWITAQGTLKIHLLPGLDLQGSANIDYRQSKSYSWYDPRHVTMINTAKNGKATHSYSQDRYNSYEAYATYRRDFDKHHVDGLVGWSFSENAGDSFSATNSDFTVDGVGPWNLGEGSSLTAGEASMSSSKDSRERLMAVFGRVNYSYDDKYLLMASYRREGSSKFGPENRFGNFWSVSGGWRAKREEFLKDVSWLSDLKIRAGYGVTGNNGISSGIYTPVVSYYGDYPVNGKWIHAYGTKASYNQGIKWEEKHEFNVGFDFALFNNRLWGRFDWYKRNVTDLVYSALVPLPDYMYDHCYLNIGSLTNNGWELELGGTVIKTPRFKWNSTIRASHSSSRISHLGDEGSYVTSTSLPAPGSPGSVSRIEAGSRIGQYWLYRYAGLSEDGKWMIYNKDGEAVLANSTNLVSDNRFYMGDAIPKVMLSWDNTFNYRNFDLGIQMHAWINFDIYNANAMYNGIRTQTATNVLRDWYYDHQAINDGDHVLTDYFMEDGTFLKIDAITLGYNLRLSKYTKYIDSIRFYTTIRDIATITGYSGYNPEVTATGLFPGVELPTIGYPQATRFTFGIQFSL
jgi:TonB-linked SusC/RagA family outer membrane protein